MNTYRDAVVILPDGSRYPCRARLTQWNEQVPERSFGGGTSTHEGLPDWAGLIILEGEEAAWAVQQADHPQLQIEGQTYSFFVTGGDLGSGRLEIRA